MKKKLSDKLTELSFYNKTELINFLYYLHFSGHKTGYVLSLLGREERVRVLQLPFSLESLIDNLS